MKIFSYWELVKHLSIREIKARYKQSFLGFFWIALNPFFQMITMSFVFSNILRTGDLGVPYPIFIYAGLLPWLFFANSVSSAMSVLTDNASLIKKIYFPREILVLSTILAKIVDFFVASVIFIALMIFFKLPVTPVALLFIPILLIQIMFTFGVALFLSAMNLLYRDVQYIFNLILTIWFYLTPVLYATEFFPEKYRFIFKLNPLSVFINAYRQVILNGDLPNISSLSIGTILSVAILIISYRIFKKLEGIFADVV